MVVAALLTPLALLAPAPSAPAAPLAPSAPLALFLLGHAVGSETSSITSEAGRSVLTAHFQYLDRATTIDLESSLAFKSDFSPLSFESHGRSYRVFPVDASVPTVTAANTFTADGVAPIAVQGLLIRYWLAHGKPASITVLPSGDVVTVRQAPHSLSVTGVKSPVLRQFTIGGLAWGRQRLWLRDDDLSVAAAVSSVGVLGFEAVSTSVPGPLNVDTFIRAAVRDRLEEAATESRSAAPLARGSFALTNARLIDGTGAPAVNGATIVVRDGRIAAAGPAARVTIPANVRRVDVAGKTVLPGLWDMHAHAGLAEWGPVYLASGVTTIRDMGGEFETLTALRDAWNQGRALGPRMLMAGLVDGPGPGSFGQITAGTPQEGRDVVARYQAAGFQQMKLYSLLDRPTAQAVIDAAHAAGMSVTGHIPNGLSMREIVEMGIDHLAHLTVRDAPGSDAMRETIAFLEAHHTVIDPTLSWNELLGRSAQTPIAAFIPRVAHVAPPLRRMLEAANGGNVTPQQAHDRLARSLQIVKALHEAGIPVVAGTDKGVPGVSLAREIELYVEAGFSTMDAIRAATAIPAQVMGLATESGTLATGLRADLIVVDGNPLAQISDIANVVYVCAAGTLYEPARLWPVGGFRNP